MQENPILVLDTADGLNKLKIEYLSGDFAEKELNGENSYHIFHVSMVTEHLLRELCSQNPDISLSEDDIAAIATASSAHDIGKLKVPKSILDHPGTLSPVEYDIVKKHALLGEQIIREADRGEVSERIVNYAAEIARYHHERVDGTGYPEGIRGNAIPIWAQVVAVADAYDALTSSRSYKQAFSQDVALQMISSGMCGAFDERITACLMRVVNHQTLRSFKEKLQRMRSVTADYSDLTLSRVLIIGNTEYIDNDFIKKTFPDSKVTVIGNSDLEGSGRLRLFRIRKPSIRAVMETYEYDLIVFFAEGLTFRSSNKNDAEELREVLKYTARLQTKAKLLYLSPLDSSFEDQTDRAIISAANEKLCEFYAQKYSLDIKTLQIPYLYSGTLKKDFLNKIFEQLYAKETATIPESPLGRMHFLSLGDLSELIARIVDTWRGGGVLSVGDEFGLTFKELADALTEIIVDLECEEEEDREKKKEEVKIEFTHAHCSGIFRNVNSALRNEYGWYAKVSILKDLKDQYERFLATKEHKTFFAKVKDWIAEHSMLIKISELIVMFVLSEVLVRVTRSYVIFSIVDFRTIFVLIMATLYGPAFGAGSAFLASVSYFIAKVEAGANAMTIFYEPTNWLAFVLFFLVGGLCGYVHLKREDYCATLEEKSGILEDKLGFMSELYDDTLYDKNELKKQIISSKDSFGKIFDITRRLNTVAPHELYLKIVETFEEVLSNKSIAVYSINSDSSFGRLEVASRDLNGVVARSVRVESYGPVIEQFKDGGIWKNTELNREYPAYAAGVYRGDNLILMIFLWHATMDQRTLYYVNLFKILRDLAQMSLLRAHDYSAAMFEKQYISGTRILCAEYFAECERNLVALSEKKVSAFFALDFDLNGHTIEEADEILAAKVRANDILGVTAEGALRLLLSQATEDDMKVILPRFEGLDILPIIPGAEEPEEEGEGSEETTEAGEEAEEAIEDSAEAIEDSAEATEESAEATEEPAEATEESAEATEESAEATEESAESGENDPTESK